MKRNPNPIARARASNLQLGGEDKNPSKITPTPQLLALCSEVQKLEIGNLDRKKLNRMDAGREAFKALHGSEASDREAQAMLTSYDLIESLRKT